MAAVRSLRRTPAFAAVAVLSLALAIVANTAVFTVVHAFLLRSLPVPDPNGLALLKVQRPKALLNGLFAMDSYSFSYHLFQKLEQHSSLFSSLLVTSSGEFVHNTGDATVSIPGAFVNGEYFQALELSPEMGRLIAPRDEHSLVAVISDAFWARAFNRDVHAMGKSIQLDGNAVTIIGVTPASFHGVMVGIEPDVFLPLESQNVLHAPFGFANCDECEFLTAMARLKPHDTLARLNAKLGAISRDAFADYPAGTLAGNSRKEVLKNKLGAVSGRSGYTYLRRAFTDPLRLLMGLAVLVVLMACANLASLLLARSAVRQREFLVRGALGASRARLIRQVLTETLLLTGGGTLAGIPLAYALSKYLAASLFARQKAFHLNLVPSPAVMLFMTGILVLCCLAVGLAPALRQTGVSSPAGNGTRMNFSERSKRWLPRLLLVFQVGLSLVLVTAALLFSGTLFHLRKVPLGFQPRGVVILSYSWTNKKATDSQKKDFARQALARVRAIPGVSSAAITSITPLAGTARFGEVSAAGSSHVFEVWNNAVSAGYFDAMQTRILEGRDFNGTAADHDALILSRGVAQDLFPNGGAVGGSVLYNKKVHPVIGVVEESKYQSIRNGQSTVFEPNGVWASTFLIRYSGSVSGVVSEAGRQLRELSPDVLVKSPLLMENLVNETLATESLLATLGNYFGGLALLLMAIGLYGTLAYLTARRTPEIGVRMALGADGWSVIWTVAKENFAVASFGAALGLGGAAAAVRYVKTFLYGVEALDPVVLAAAVGLIGIVAAVATGLPARRAARIEPMEALRCE